MSSIVCREKAGIEVNPTARANACSLGLKVYEKTADVPDGWADLIISNSALEHALHPLMELQRLHPKLKEGGLAVFVVPCELPSHEYFPNDRDHHLYSWSPMSLGNLFTEAGFNVEQSWPYLHMWPPRCYKTIARIFGRGVFEIVCKLYGRSWFSRHAYGYVQLRIVAHRTRA